MNTVKTCFRISAVSDIALIPYSPVCERDLLEIRCRVYNEGGDADAVLTFCIDGKPVGSETVSVKEHCYGYAKCLVSMRGMAGKHTVSVNGEAVPLEVLSERKPVLDGGFVMLGPPNDRTACSTFRRAVKQMTDDDWKRYIDALAKLGQSCVIIMAAYQFLNIGDGTICAHFDSELYPKSDIAAADPIAAILSEAGKHGMKVFIGVGNAYGWQGTAACFEEVYRRYGGYPAFYGWYMGHEFNMQAFEPARGDEFASLAAAARKLNAVKPVLTSPFGSPGAAFVEYMKTHDVLDIMMPQDCVGQCRLSLEGSRNAYRVLSDICSQIGKHLWANCEAFNFMPAEIGGRMQDVLVPRYKGGGMNGDEGFIRQLETVRPYSEKLMTFMFSGFFCPPGFEPAMGGAAAVKQFEEYAAYHNRCT